VLAAIAATFLGGCASWRVVLEPVPPADALEERVVLEADAGGGSAKIAMIDVDGLIADAPGGLLGGGTNPVAEFSRALARAADDTRVKAVVLRINSRGGTVTGSDMVHGEVQRFRRETNKPVVVLLGEIAASGGYYLACAGDEIIAHPTTITGSIGVITQTVQLGPALERLGVVADAVVSGPNKAMASPLGVPDAGHREILQSMVDDFYGRFRDVVREGRPGIDPAVFDQVTDGRVVTGRQALELGLVDRLGDAHDAFARARELAGVDRARLIRYLAPGARANGVYSAGRAQAAAAAAGNGAGAAAAGGIEVNLLRVDGLDAAFLPSARFLYVWAAPVG
jgi:protease-4